MNNFVIIYSEHKNKNSLYKYVQKYCRNHPGNGYNEVSGKCKIGDVEFFVEDGLLIQNISINDAIDIAKKVGGEYVLSSDTHCYKSVNCVNEIFSFDGVIKYPGGYCGDCSYKELKI